MNGVRLYPFPAPRTLLDADPLELRELGLSVNKINALNAVGAAIESGELDESTLEPLSTPELIAALVAHKGIGPWTGAVVALRGFGRLDIFPMNDSGAEAGLRKLSGDPQHACRADHRSAPAAARDAVLPLAARPSQYDGRGDAFDLAGDHAPAVARYVLRMLA